MKALVVIQDIEERTKVWAVLTALGYATDALACVQSIVEVKQYEPDLIVLEVCEDLVSQCIAETVWLQSMEPGKAKLIGLQSCAELSEDLDYFFTIYQFPRIISPVSPSALRNAVSAVTGG